jgi:hypothetical protein
LVSCSIARATRAWLLPTPHGTRNAGPTGRPTASCAAGSVCRRGWMSGRPEKKNGRVYARDETTGPDDGGARRRRVWSRLLPSSRFASAGFLRTTRTWRPAGTGRARARAAGRRHQRSIQISELCCPAYIPHGLQDRHQPSKQLRACACVAVRC